MEDHLYLLNYITKIQSTRIQKEIEKYTFIRGGNFDFLPSKTLKGTYIETLYKILNPSIELNKKLYTIPLYNNYDGLSPLK